MKKGVWMVVCAAISWATLPVFSRLLGGHGIDALSAAAMRAYLATLMLLVWSLKQHPFKRFDRRDTGHFALTGALAVVGTYSFYLLAIEHLNFAMAAILLYTAPAFVTLFSRVLYKEPISKRKLIALALTFAGSFFVVRAYDSGQLRLNALGIAFGVASGFCYSMLTVLGSKRIDAYGSQLNCTYMTAFGAVFFLLIRPPWKIPLLTAPTLGLFAGLALFGSVLPYVLYLLALQSGLDGRDASIIATLEPVLVALLGVVAFDESLAWPQMFGIALTVAGACLAALTPRKQAAL